jgi:hypothetical protein
MNNDKGAVAYGKSRLVLLPVDPYLIHAYWQIVPRELHEAKTQAGAARAVLRFYKIGKTRPKDAPADWFDVEVDLQSPNWYVHLWSAEHAYRVDLALKKKDGSLVRMVTAQVVQMPRTVPAIAVDQHFMKVEVVKPEPESVPPPAPAPVSVLVERPQPQRIPSQSVNRPTVRSTVAKPIDSSEIVREKLRKLYASLQWRRSDHILEPETRPEQRSDLSTSEARVDLTAKAEKNLVPGLSSASLQKDDQESGRSSKK